MLGGRDAMEAALRFEAVLVDNLRSACVQSERMWLRLWRLAV